MNDDVIVLMLSLTLICLGFVIELLYRSRRELKRSQRELEEFRRELEQRWRR